MSQFANRITSRQVKLSKYSLYMNIPNNNVQSDEQLISTRILGSITISFTHILNTLLFVDSVLRCSAETQNLAELM